MYLGVLANRSGIFQSGSYLNVGFAEKYWLLVAVTIFYSACIMLPSVMPLRCLDFEHVFF